jgi:3-oxoacyl-[acyl-carrier-protein] synthase-3
MTPRTGRRVKIAATGFYAPEKILTNADLEKMVDTSDEWIVTRTGIKERHIASDSQATSDLCLQAAQRALRNGNFHVRDIDLIIVGTASPDTLFPSTACWLQKGLQADHVAAFDISAACTGVIYGMILAESLINRGVSKRVLLVGGEVLTKITNWKDRGTCVLFGDAAGALIVEESTGESGILSRYWKADGSLADLLYQPAGGTRMPASMQTVAGDLHTIQMKGNEVFKHAVKRMGEAALEALKGASLKKEDVDWFIPHQANTRIIYATAERIKIPREKVYVNIQNYGNVSVASIPISLHELYAAGKLKKGNIILMDAFGAGFTWGAIVYRW